ncbi:MAG: hypothetical protein WKF36_11005, partial [Candidatus Nitrosocosmicus sp.]
MIKHNRLIAASVFLMLIFAMPGMPDFVTKIYAASFFSELLAQYLNGHGLLDKYRDEPFLRYSDLLPDKTPSTSPQSRQLSPSASLTED